MRGTYSNETMIKELRKRSKAPLIQQKKPGYKQQRFLGRTAHASNSLSQQNMNVIC